MNRPIRNLAMQAAIHQAGHAIVAKALGMPFNSIAMDRPCDGTSYFDVRRAEGIMIDLDHPADMASCARLIGSVLVAGETGELMFGGRMAQGADLDYALELLHQMGEGSEAEFKRVGRVALELIGANHGLVKRVAEELLRRRNLSAAEVDQICKSTGRELVRVVGTRA